MASTEEVGLTQVVAQNVRVLRGACGWTQDRLIKELARVGNVWERGGIAKLETGRRKTVTVEDLASFAQIFAVEPWQLLKPLSVTTSITVQDKENEGQ